MKYLIFNTELFFSFNNKLKKLYTKHWILISSFTQKRKEKKVCKDKMLKKASCFIDYFVELFCKVSTNEHQLAS